MGFSSRFSRADRRFAKMGGGGRAKEYHPALQDGNGEAGGGARPRSEDAMRFLASSAVAIRLRVHERERLSLFLAL